MPCFEFLCLNARHHHSTFFRPRLNAAFNVHGANNNSSLGRLCARSPQKTPSRASAVESRSQLIELGAATCVDTWPGHGFEKAEPTTVSKRPTTRSSFCFYGQSMSGVDCSFSKIFKFRGGNHVRTWYICILRQPIFLLFSLFGSS